MHDRLLEDGSLILRPMTEDDWETVAAWNNDPAVLWFTDNGAVSERSLAQLQGIHRGVSRAADLFVFELDGVAVGDVGSKRTSTGSSRTPGSRARKNRSAASAVRVGPTSRHEGGATFDWVRLRPRRRPRIFGCGIADFNDRSRRTFLRCGYVPWRRVSSWGVDNLRSRPQTNHCSGEFARGRVGITLRHRGRDTDRVGD